MNYIFAFAYLTIFLLSLLIIKTRYKTIICPLTIFAITFCLFPFVVTLKPLGLYDLSLETHLYILLSYFTFFLSFLFFTNNITKGLTHAGKSVVNNSLNYFLLIVVNLAIFIYLVPKVFVSWNIIQSQGWISLRNNYEEIISSSTTDNIIYTWFIKTFITASIAVLSFDVFNNRNKMQIPSIIVVLLNVLLDVVLFAARATLVKLIVFLVLAFLFCRVRKESISLKYFLLLGLIVLAMLLVLFYVTNERMSDGTYSTFSIFDSAVMYYCAPFSLFNYYVQNPSFAELGTNGLQFGSATFGFVYNIIRSGLYIVFGLEYNGSDYIVTQVTSQTIRVGSSVSINAACTSIYIFMRDFGIFGIIFGFILCAFSISSCFKYFKNSPSTRSGSLYIFFLYFIFRLSSTYDFMSPGSFFAICYIILLTYRRHSKFKERSIYRYEIKTID